MSAAVLDAKALVECCEAVVAGAASTVRELEAEVTRRASDHATAVRKRSSCEHTFDVDESAESAASLADAVRAHEAAALLVAKSRARLEQSKSSHETSRRALDSARKELRVAELREQLDVPLSFGSPLAALSRVERARRELVAAERAFSESLAPIFDRVDADGVLVRQLGELDQTDASPCMIHRVAPLLANLAIAGKLFLNTSPSWELRSVNPGGSGRWTHVLWGAGALSAAWGSLGPMRAALGKRDPNAIRAALEQLATPIPCDMASVWKMLDIIGEHASEAGIVSAIAEAERPEGAKFEADARQREADIKARQHEEADGRAGEWRRAQARRGNDTARKSLGLDEVRQPTVINDRLPGEDHPVVRAAATVGTFLDKAVAAITK